MGFKRRVELGIRGSVCCCGYTGFLVNGVWKFGWKSRKCLRLRFICTSWCIEQNFKNFVLGTEKAQILIEY